jgi:hypothetical protein
VTAPEAQRRRRRALPPWQHDTPVHTISTKPEVRYNLSGTLSRFLADGEHLLALVDNRVAPGRWNVESPPHERSPGQKAADRAAAVAVALAGGATGPSLNRMLGTEAVRGRLGSWADRMLRARWMDRGKPAYPLCLFVSDRRLALVGRISAGEAGYQTAMELPADAVADVRLVPKPLARGRVVIDFSDDSMITLKYGAWRTGVARCVVDAVSQWRIGVTGGTRDEHPRAEETAD